MVVNMKRILIIEDDESIAQLQKDYLEMSGYEVVCTYTGTDGLKAFEQEPFDLVLLDLMLPGIDGFEILKVIGEAKQVPVLVVSAKQEEMFKIKGLNLGADDYITKPFGTGELVARVNAHLKKYEKLRGMSVTQAAAKRLVIRGIEIDEEDRRVFVNDREVILKQKEFDVLLFLAKNPNRVYSKEAIFERIWDMDALSDTSTVTVHIARIREKVEQDPSKPDYIETVWGAGYRFRV